MKRGFVIFSVVVAVLGAFALGRAGAQEGPEPKAGCEDMAAWMELAKPGPQHEQLMKSAGTWTCEGKHWQAPDAPPVIGKGKAVRTAILGGRFLKEEVESEMMGMPFHGIGFTAFNNATEEYEAAWMDSMGTGIMVLTGTEEDGVLTLTGSYAGPGGETMKTRIVSKREGDDKLMMEMYCDMGKGEMKCMEQTYTRSK